MVTRLLHRLCLTLAALVITATGLLAAFELAPDRDALAREASLAALGADAGDICGDTVEHATHCPFCHLLPGDTPLRPMGAEGRVHPVKTAPGTAQTAITATCGPAIGPRGPPLSA